LRTLASRPALAALLLAAAPAAAADRPHIEATASDHLGFLNGASFINVRENGVLGDRLSLPVLGVRHVQIVEADVDLPLGRRGEIALQVRDFLADGSRTLDREAVFNGATLAAGQTIQTKPTWTSLGLYYKHRWSTLTAFAGFEYVSLNFRLNGGHAAVTPTSPGTETKEGFLVQELPVPTFGVAERRPIAGPLWIDASLSGNWINNVSSGRKEGGTIYLSQRRVEADVAARLSDDNRFRRFHPFAGVFYYAYRQREESGEDGNLISVVAIGPYGGIQLDF